MKNEIIETLIENAKDLRYSLEYGGQKSTVYRECYFALEGCVDIVKHFLKDGRGTMELYRLLYCGDFETMAEKLNEIFE